MEPPALELRLGATSGLDWDQWDVIVQFAVPNLVTLYGLLLVPAAIAVWRSPQWRFWLGIASAAVLPILVFMNLYVAHDYYFVAVSPAVAALVGLGAGKLWSVAAASLARGGAAARRGALAGRTVDLKAAYWSRIDGDSTDPTSCRSLARSIDTAAGDLVGVVGQDWSPAVLYYAHRRGHMVTDGSGDLAFDLIHRDGYRHLVVTDPAHDDLSFLGRWRMDRRARSADYDIAQMAAELPRRWSCHRPGRRAHGSASIGLRRSRGRPKRSAAGGYALGAGDRGTWLRSRRAARSAPLRRRPRARPGSTRRLRGAGRFAGRQRGGHVHRRADTHAREGR